VRLLAATHSLAWAPDDAIAILEAIEKVGAACGNGEGHPALISLGQARSRLVAALAAPCQWDRHELDSQAELIFGADDLDPGTPSSRSGYRLISGRWRALGS
jgi:hypothetical protein